jgi:hypothetical protein
MAPTSTRVTISFSEDPFNHEGDLFENLEVAMEALVFDDLSTTMPLMPSFHKNHNGIGSRLGKGKLFCSFVHLKEKK